MPVHFEIRVYDLTREQSESILEEVTSHNSIEFEEKLYHLDEDFGDQLGALRTRLEDGSIGGVYNAFHKPQSDENGKRGRLKISFYKERSPELRLRETHHLDEFHNNISGLNTVRNEVSDATDEDVEFLIL